MTMTISPRVSIGLPVFNGAQFLREALDDLLAQDFTDFELIVSDNGSTDDTPAIIEEFARRDARIAVIRHPQNIGAYPNYENILRHARAPYFMYAAHDDRWRPSFVRRLVHELDTRPRAVMAFCDAISIDEYSQATGEYPSLHTCGLGVAERLRELIRRFAWLEVYALMRTDLMRSLGAFKPFSGGDVCFSFEMQILGEIAAVREPLFWYRIPSMKKTSFAYYAGFNESTRQTIRTYSELVRHLYHAAVQAHLPAAVLACVREYFIDVIGTENAAWMRSIVAEHAIAQAALTPQLARALVTKLVDTHDAVAPA